MKTSEIRKLIREEVKKQLREEHVNDRTVDKIVSKSSIFIKFYKKNYPKGNDVEAAIHDFAGKLNIKINNTTAEYLADTIFVDL